MEPAPLCDVTAYGALHTAEETTVNTQWKRREFSLRSMFFWKMDTGFKMTIYFDCVSLKMLAVQIKMEEMNVMCALHWFNVLPNKCGPHHRTSYTFWSQWLSPSFVETLAGRVIMFQGEGRVYALNVIIDACVPRLWNIHTYSFMLVQRHSFMDRFITG